MNIKHTPGPWIYTAGGDWKFPCVQMPSARLQGRYLTINEPTGEASEVYEANARLIAAAPAMDLALSMISCGVARIERCGRLEEFCFDGIRYCLNGDWNALFNVIGWNKARAAIAKATGAKTP